NEQVAADALVELGRLAAERRDPDRVLEQAAGVRMVLRARRQPSHRTQGLRVEDARDRRAQPRMRQLSGEELEEALELVRIPARARCEVARIGFWRRLERAHVQL